MFNLPVFVVFILKKTLFRPMDHESNYFDSTSGVPQETNIGPLFFPVFINDLILLKEINFTVPRLSAASSTTFYCSKLNTNMLLTSSLHQMCSTYNSFFDVTVDIHFTFLPSLINKCNVKITNLNLVLEVFF